MPSSLSELTAALVAIDSVNPALVPGGAGEREIASFVADWCAEHGLDVETLGAERPSVVATKRGSGGGRSLLLNGHLDTVGVAGMPDPFVPRLDGDRLFGRGAADMKGGVAAVVAAAEHLVATGARVRPVLALVADMEAPLWQRLCPTVVCGPSGGGLHAVDEWVDVRQVRALASALVAVLATWRPDAA